MADTLPLFFWLKHNRYNKFITDINVLKESDDAAAAEARAQKGRPGYCGDEYYRALAGGSAATCKKFDN